MSTRLSHKNFTLLVIGQIISLFGSSIQRFALSLYLLDLTGSASVFASILGEQAALAAISGLYGIVFGLDRGKIVSVDLRDAVTNKKVYPEDLKHLAEIISY